MEKGICSWCAQPGIVSFTPLKTDYNDPRINKSMAELNDRVMSKKLIKMSEGVFACKKCVSAYDLRTSESSS